MFLQTKKIKPLKMLCSAADSNLKLNLVKHIIHQVNPNLKIEAVSDLSFKVSSKQTERKMSFTSTIFSPEKSQKYIQKTFK